MNKIKRRIQRLLFDTTAARVCMALIAYVWSSVAVAPIILLAINASVLITGGEYIDVCKLTVEQAIHAWKSTVEIFRFIRFVDSLDLHGVGMEEFNQMVEEAGIFQHLK